MNSSTINYETLQLEDIKKNPDGQLDLLDFKNFHRARNFDISCVEEFPDKNWAQERLWQSWWNFEKLDISLVEEFPDKNWEKERIWQCVSQSAWSLGELLSPSSSKPVGS